MNQNREIENADQKKREWNDMMRESEGESEDGPESKGHDCASWERGPPPREGEDALSSGCLAFQGHDPKGSAQEP